jgi:hypothetical protein
LLFVEGAPCSFEGPPPTTVSVVPTISPAMSAPHVLGMCGLPFFRLSIYATSAAMSSVLDAANPHCNSVADPSMQERALIAANPSVAAFFAGKYSTNMWKFSAVLIPCELV